LQRRICSASVDPGEGAHVAINSGVTGRERTTAGDRRSGQLRFDSDHAADLHLVRLCLDLQVEALLFALGAVASDACYDSMEKPQWRAWVAEDVEWTSSLAADVVAGGSNLPTPLGACPQPDGPSVLLEHLAARYEMISRLLVDLRDRFVAKDHPELGRIDEALRHYDVRLRELRLAQRSVDR
jgi:hypothetical protein